MLGSDLDFLYPPTRVDKSFFGMQPRGPLAFTPGFQLPIIHPHPLIIFFLGISGIY